MTNIDPYLYTQIGLDSGSLTLLGSIVHRLGEPGQYRVAVHHGETVLGVCIVTAELTSPVAQVTVDLAAIAAAGAATTPAAPGADADCACCGGQAGSAGTLRFTVNPKGYVLLGVGSGAGGYYVHVRRIEADPKDKGYDSRALREGDLFSAVILRPGTYSVSHAPAAARGHIVVSYPRITEKAYVPPPPVRVMCGQKSLEPSRIDVQPGQGIIFEPKAPSRIVIRLEKADDGPQGSVRRARAGWTKPTLK